MKNSILNYFYYTRSERNGMLALSVLLIILFVAPRFYKHLGHPEPEKIFITTKEAAAFPEKVHKKRYFNFREKNRNAAYPKWKKYYGDSAAGGLKNHAPSLKKMRFPFDPNTIPEDSLKMLGLPAFTIRTLVHYREKGGTFRKKEDLKRLYSLEESDYEGLAPYILLPDTLSRPAFTRFTRESSPKYPSKPAVVVDINQATEADWQQLRGIGPGYAARIVRFRDKLGGFYRVDQVRETFGLPDSVFVSIQSSLRISPILKKIHLNSVSLTDLKTHPYLNWRQSEAIIRYREQHGRFSSLDELVKIGSLDAALVERISPYLELD